MTTPPNDKDPVDAMIKRTTREDVPADVRDRLHRHLARFQGNLDAAAALPSERFVGLRRALRVGTVAAMAAMLIAMALFTFGSGAKPTWAEVRERFDSVPGLNASIYVKTDAVSEPVQLELWMQQGGLLRMRAGDTVIFGKRGLPLETVSLSPGTKPSSGIHHARNMISQIVEILGEEDEFSLETLLRAVPFGDVQSAPLANYNASVSDDLVVFDISDTDSPEWIRIWALRESRLPVRLLFWDPRSTHRVDVVLSYTGTQSVEFFDPEAFKASLSKSQGSSQAYNLQRDPGGRPVTPRDVVDWNAERERRALETESESAAPASTT
ncbi:MAG: hypothetical protein GY851_27845 [bacterium]|nr:hypothetical protein [bacterium]